MIRKARDKIEGMLSLLYSLCSFQRLGIIEDLTHPPCDILISKRSDGFQMAQVSPVGLPWHGRHVCDAKVYLDFRAHMTSSGQAVRFQVPYLNRNNRHSSCLMLLYVRNEYIEVQTPTVVQAGRLRTVTF
jgi:hypothetical protein